MSPEQQRFAKGFRSMQLASSLFTLAVIQIKPQLEKVLGLPPSSLANELELTRDLLSLLTEFNIPTDQLCVNKIAGAPELSREKKIAEVRESTACMNALVQRARDAQLKEARAAEAQRLAMLPKPKSKPAPAPSPPPPAKVYPSAPPLPPARFAWFGRKRQPGEKPKESKYGFVLLSCIRAAIN